MKCIIIHHSYHHNNTERLANAISETIGADIMPVIDARPTDLQAYDLVGFGAGIDSGRHYKPLLDFAEQIPYAEGKRAFIFSTAGVTGAKKVSGDHRALREILMNKGYTIAGEYGCRGFNTNSILKYIGGINKGRPSEEDLEKARQFALGLIRE